MIVTPHVAIDTIKDIGANPAIFSVPKALPGLMRLLGDAVMFDFGTTLPDKTHTDFALDLYEKGLFRLPYPVSAFSFRARPSATVYVDAKKPAGAMLVLHMDSQGGMSCLMVTEQQEPGGKSVGAVPIGIVMKMKLKVFDPATSTATIEDETFPLLSERLMKMMYGVDGKQGQAVMRERLVSNMVNAMGFVVMLMSKGVSAQRFEAPAKLNKSRLAKGKALIGDRYVVSLDLESQYRIATEDGEEDIAGHKRGSPRVHWRRGVFRVLHRDSERERIVPVAPCIVGAGGNDGYILKPGEYRIKEGGIGGRLDGNQGQAHFGGVRQPYRPPAR